MRLTLSRLISCVMRGYGQMFLANGVVPGALIFLGLLALAPIDALRSLVCAVIVTAWAQWRSSDALVETGLYGVNGVLLGLVWLQFPEVSEFQKWVFSSVGSLGMATGMVPCAQYVRKMKWPFALFSLPYDGVGWLIIVAIYGFGIYDPHQYNAWSELVNKNPERAIDQFSAVKSSHPKAEGFRQNGLGWAYFQMGNLSQAKTRFKSAVEQAPDHSDSFAGLGWAEFKTGEFVEAQKAFETSIALDAWNADAWDGLGWIRFYNNDIAEADRCFISALRAAPFLCDGYAGRSACAAKTADKDSQHLFGHRSELLAKYVSPQSQHISNRSLVCWALFLIAIAVHSRTSLAVLVSGLALSAFAGRNIPALSAALSDINFVLNLAPLYLALGGQYMKLNVFGVLYMAAMTVVLAFAWPVLESVFHSQSMPQLGIAFNVILIGTLILLRIPKRFGMDFEPTVPLEIAVTSPQAVRCWEHKARIVKRAWDMIASK